MSFPLQERPQLPSLPSDFRLSALARGMAGNASGEVLETRTASDGRACPVRLRVDWSPTATLPQGEIVDLRWEDGHPPVLLGDPPERPHRHDALCVFDASRRLLVVSYQDDRWSPRLLSELGIARFPSRRFSEEELDWAWLANRRHAFRLHIPSVFTTVERFVPMPGHRELVLRFGSRDQKLEVLGRLQAIATLTPDDVENLELCLWDLGELQSLAVHTLLEHGQRVDPAPFLSEDNRLCARLALGDEGARAEVLERLERAQRVLLWDPRVAHSAADIEEYQTVRRTERLPVLAEIAAYGTSEALPYLRAFVRNHVENSAFAWLFLGGSEKDLLELHGGDPMEIGPLELTRAGTIEALRLALARCSSASETKRGSVTSELSHIDVLVDRLRPREPKAVLELVRPVVRRLLEQGHDDALLLRRSLLRAGDELVIAELDRMSADEIGKDPPPELAYAPGAKVVAILVKLLVRSLAGFEWDDTGQALRNVAYLSSVLQGRSAGDRALALRLFESSSLPPHASRDDVTCIRWALGELPEPQLLLQLGPSYVVGSCRLELASEATRYASVLPELRKDPRRFWWPLALLRDEASLPAFGRWLAEGVDSGRRSWEALTAIEKIGSPTGANWIYEAIRGLDPVFDDDCSTILGEIESPDHLARLASFCAAQPLTAGESAWRAFLILLGRRP